MEQPQKVEPVNPFMDVYKSKKPDGSLHKLKLRIVVRGDLQNNDIIGNAWYSTASTSNLIYLLAYASKHK